MFCSLSLSVGELHLEEMEKGGACNDLLAAVRLCDSLSGRRSRWVALPS